MNNTFKEQLNTLLNCELKSSFPTARNMKRKLYFYVGPTNSGKTYQAMSELKEADCGIYLAPLRLLALENYESLKEHGVLPSLVTGEEEIFHEDSTHICSTIEMINFNLETDVCIIDEIQMIDDIDRGWAWVNAIVGAPASKVIMTGSVNALDAVKKIASYLGEELEIVKFQRKNPLVVLDHHIPIKDITKGTALIAFSRNDVLKYKSKLSKFFNVSVLYGNLSPEVRREEAKRFREGKTDILVATDAIAMGLNLPIKTILFTTDTKFDGISKRKLLPNEVIQIAGRAGRYGHHEVGYIGATTKSSLNHIDKMFNSPMKTIKPPFKVKATMEQIEELSSHLQTKSLAKILHYFSKNMKFDGPFIATNISNMIELSTILDKKHGLRIQDKYILAQAPINTRSPLIRDAYFAYINAIYKKKKCDYRLFINTRKLASTQKDLLQAEDEVKKISLYLWLSYKLPEIFIDGAKAFSSRQSVNKYCEDSLKLNLSNLDKSKRKHYNRNKDRDDKYSNSKNNDRNNKPFRKRRKSKDDDNNRSGSQRRKHTMRKRAY